MPASAPAATLVTSIDDAPLRSSLTGLANTLEKTGLPKAGAAAGKIVASRIAQNFEGLPGLKESTVKARRSRSRRLNKPFVKADDTPLRALDDSLFKAATALDSGVRGSAYSVDGQGVQVGIDDDAETGIIYADRAMGITGGYERRDPIGKGLTDADVDAVDRLYADELSATTTKAERGEL